MRARPGRKARRHQAEHHHRQAKTQRRKTERDEARSEACIPTGQRCPSKKPRGKRARKLGCTACCQGSFTTDAAGKKVCGCQPNGGSCTTATASSCCSGFCDGTTCQAAPCSASIPCPQCQTCNATTGLCESLPDGSTCDDGNACTQTDTCQSGVCIGSNPVVCTTPPACHLASGATCNPATGQCEYPAQPNRTSCGGSNLCCGGTCCAGCCSTNEATGGTCGGCRVFVTSDPKLNGNLGGLMGADGICQSKATDAGLPGSYKAWLSAEGLSPAGGRFRRSGMPYVLVNGTLVAADWTDLTTCESTAPFTCLAHAIDLTETRITPGGNAEVWTNTNADGSERDPNNDCADWMTTAATGFFGFFTATQSSWASTGITSCVLASRLYCFQQD